MSPALRGDSFPIEPPIKPMLAKLTDSLPAAGHYLFEPKWDGFRALVFRGAAEVYIQSRDLKPLNRYFPELHDALRALPSGCILDGEIIIRTPDGLDFDALQLRLHPAESRVKRLAGETPASFVAFDLLAAPDGQNLMTTPQEDRRRLLEQLFSKLGPPLHLTPMTRDREVAARWLEEFEGAGLDGVIAKPADGTYEPGKRAMLKIKHARTAECVVAGFRWYKTGRDAVGSLLLGLYDSHGTLQHVGVTSSFRMAVRRQLVTDLAPLREAALEDHPWRSWAEAGAGEHARMPGGQSRWSAGKDLSWVPLRIERVCEVKYDHLQGSRFRHAATFLRWRPDKAPEDCRYDQLEIARPYDLDQVFASGSSGS